MTAPHFFSDDVAEERIVLSGSEARHAARVLRIRPGEQITISDGRGTVVRAVVSSAGPDLVADVVERRVDERPPPSLQVFHAIPKAGKLDVVVQKLTELGVDVIQPFPAERSVARWDGRKAADQTRRLALIAREAAKQSRRRWLPEVLPAAPLADLTLPAATFALHEEATTRLGDRLPNEAPERLGLVVGPEGGFSPEEVSFLATRGAESVTLGSLVLRTETAALVGAVVVLGRYGRIG